VAEQAYAYVTLIPVAKGFQGAIAKEMGGVANVGKQAGEGAGSKFASGFGSVMKGVAVVGAAAVGVAAAGIGLAMNKGFERLTNIENARNLLQGIGHDAETVETVMDNALASVKGTAFGLGDAARVAAGAVAAGIEPGEALERQLKVIADTASVAGTSLDDIGAIMGKVTTTNKASNRELQQLAERGIPVYQMLADQMGVTGEEIFDMASKGEISAEMLETALMDNLGGAALTAGETTEGAFANMQASISRVGANLLGPTFEQFAGFFTGLTEALGPVEEIAVELGATLGEKLEPVFASLVDLVPVLVEAFLPLVPVLMDVGIALVEAVIAILPTVIQFVASLVPVIESLLPPFLDLLPVILELAEAVLPIFAQLIADLAPLIAELAPILIELITTALAVIIPIFLELAQALMPLVEQLFPIAAELLLELAPLVLTLIEAFLPLIELVLPILISLIEFLIPIFITIAEIIGLVVVEAVGFLVAAIEWLTEKWDEFGAFFEELWNNIKSFFVDIINGIITVFEGMINGIITGINWLIQQLNKIKVEIPNWDIFGSLAGKTFGFNFSEIANVQLNRIALAEGGFVDQPTEALIGEAGPEVVMPLDRFERMMGLDEARESKTVNYYAAPNQSLSAEQELMKAMRRARLVANW
jgi:tape measure domain-containing protein